MLNQKKSEPKVIKMFSVKKTTFYDSFFKIIDDAFRTEYVCSL